MNSYYGNLCYFFPGVILSSPHLELFVADEMAEPLWSSTIDMVGGRCTRQLVGVLQGVDRHSAIRISVMAPWKPVLGEGAYGHSQGYVTYCHVALVIRDQRDFLSVKFFDKLYFQFKGTPSIPETYLSSSVAWGLNLRVG